VTFLTGEQENSMYYNAFELRVLNDYKIEELRRDAQVCRLATDRLHIRIALAHALIVVAHWIWREDVEQPAAPARSKVALT
jgi:hypothetical protein